MNYVKNVFIVVLSIFSIGLIASFEKPMNLGRYSEIIKAFDSDTKKFDSASAVTKADLEVVNARKEFLEKDLVAKKTVYATSWMPLLYKVLGVGFGLEAVRRSFLGGYMAFDQMIGVSKQIDGMVKYPLNALYYTNYPISYPIRKANNFMRSKLLNDSPYSGQGNWDTYIMHSNIFNIASSAGISLATGALAKYCFNIAMSYANEIKNIEKEIEIDTAMIDVLDKL